MLKILLRMLIILAVAGLVAGGIYLLAQNGGMSWLGIGGTHEGLLNGAGAAAGQLPARPDGGAFVKGQHFEGGRDGGAGFSLMGLTGLAMQLGKVAVITAAVVVFQTVMRLFKRRRNQPVSVPAA